MTVVFFVVKRLYNIGSRPDDYPPGPPTVPVLGNIHLMPEVDIHGQFRRWAMKYGPIYSLMLGTKNTIVLSGPKTVKDLLEKRSAWYSSRPEMYLPRLLSGDCRMVLMVCPQNTSHDQDRDNSDFFDLGVRRNVARNTQGRAQ